MSFSNFMTFANRPFYGISMVLIKHFKVPILEENLRFLNEATATSINFCWAIVDETVATSRKAFTVSSFALQFLPGWKNKSKYCHRSKSINNFNTCYTVPVELVQVENKCCWLMYWNKEHQVTGKQLTGLAVN